MRESLTILAIALIIVLTTALVGPYLVDWNAHRGAVEARLSQLLGAKVTVAGPIDVKLLPRPIFRLADVTVASPAPRAPAGSAERLDVELALTALLRGEFVFVDADLSAPRMTLVMGADGSVVLPRFAATDPDHVSLSHVSLHDGSVLVVDEAGRPVLTLAGLSGDGDADSLVGPFRFDGQVDSSRGALSFRVSTGAIDAGKLRVKGTLDAAPGLPRTDAEGVVTLAIGSNGAASPRFDGSLSAAGSLPLAGSTGVVPWSVGGRLHAEAGAVAVSNVELRAGADGRAVVMSGDGRIEGGAHPKAAFTLRARQADVPRLAVFPGSGEDRGATAVADEAAAPKAALVLAGLRSMAANPDLLGDLPFPVSVVAAVDAVTLGHLTLADLAGHADLVPGAPIAGALTVAAPDGSHVKLDGRFETGPAAVFKGRVETSTSDLGRLADSLAADLPEQAQALRGALPARSVAFNGVTDLSSVGFAAHDADLTLDRSHFTGTITLTRAVGADRARLFADLSSDALDLDALPAWRDTVAAASGLDLQLSLAARAVRLAQSDTGGVSVGQVTLQLAKAGPSVTLDRLSLADVGGATADLSGHSDGKSAHVEGRVDAHRLKDLLALVQRLAPNQAAAQLLSRADALSPALLTVAADASLDGAAPPRLSRAVIGGTVAGTTLALHMAPEGAGLAATLRLDAPEAGAMLRQLGIATLANTAVGRSRLDATARLDRDFRPIAGEVTATLGAAVFTLRGRPDAAADLTGTATLKGRDVAPLLRAVALANPEAGAVWPVELSADIARHGDRIAIDHLSGRAMGAAVAGNLAYTAPARATPAVLSDAAPAPSPPPALTGALTIDRLPATALAALALGPLPLPKAGAPWPESGYAPSAMASLPRSALALAVTTMPLTATLEAENAKLDLRLAPDLVTLSGLSARLGEGRIGGTFELRRNGKSASLSGHAEWSDLASGSPSFAGRSHGVLDLAATGGSPALLLASLAGSGTIGIEDARLPRLDGAALAHAVADTGDLSANTIDDAAIRQAITDNLDKGALALGRVSTPATVVAGVLRADPVVFDAAGLHATATGSLDLRTLALVLTTTVSLPKPPKDWVGGPPQVTVSWTGPFDAPTRAVDATALVNGLAARAIALDQARIEAFQDDIRERAFFARRLRAIEAEQKAKADAEAQALKALSPPAPPAGPPPVRPPSRPGAPIRAPLDLSPKIPQPTH